MWHSWITQRWKIYVIQCINFAKIDAENFPFCTIEPNIARVNIPDSEIG